MSDIGKPVDEKLRQEIADQVALRAALQVVASVKCSKALEEFKARHQMPWLHLGQRIRHQGITGVLIGAEAGQFARLLVAENDDDFKATVTHSWHCDFQMEYLFGDFVIAEDGRLLNPPRALAVAS